MSANPIHCGVLNIQPAIRGQPPQNPSKSDKSDNRVTSVTLGTRGENRVQPELSPPFPAPVAPFMSIVALPTPHHILLTDGLPSPERPMTNRDKSPQNGHVRHAPDHALTCGNGLWANLG